MARFMLETPKVTSMGMTFDLKVNIAIGECYGDFLRERSLNVCLYIIYFKINIKEDSLI